MKKLLTLISLLLISSSLFAENAFRDFTAKDGRVMRARLINIIGDKVKVQREDGHEFTAYLDLFSEEDQAFIKDWAIGHLMSRGGLLDVKAKSSKSDRKKEKMMGILYRNGVPSKEPEEMGDILSYKGFYKVTIDNKSELALQNLEVRYQLFFFQDQKAAKKRSDGKLKRKKDKHAINLLMPHREIEFDTTKIKMQETELHDFVDYIGGGDERSKDKLEGIWIRVYHNDKMIHEFSYPTTIASKESW